MILRDSGWLFKHAGKCEEQATIILFLTRLATTLEKYFVIYMSMIKWISSQYFLLRI